MSQCAWLMAALTLGGCGDSSNTNANPSLTTRPVATVYQINADEENGRVGCYKEPTVMSYRLTWVMDQDLVDLVSRDTRTVRRNNEFWVHVYPRLAVHAACYINTRYLIPYR
ncbi:MAG: hypothetical protein CR991_04050 [Proteobacteria bacterium]|nr:MAG: hypothetical protein CR991_04050 [Pseudomonadota bacterium]